MHFLKVTIPYFPALSLAPSSSDNNTHLLMSLSILSLALIPRNEDMIVQTDWEKMGFKI